MTFCCPSCGAEATLDVIITHDETRALMALVLELSLPLGALVTRYLRLFKPAKQALRPERTRKLLDALVPDLLAATIQRKGRSWHVGQQAWKAGLEAVLDAHAKGALNLPLADHGYLYEVLMRLANQQEGREEAQVEATRRSQRNDAPQPVSVEQVLVAPPEAAPPPDYSQPSSYARRLRAQNEARNRQREGGSDEPQ